MKNNKMKYMVIGLLFVLSACATQSNQGDAISTSSYKPVDSFNKWLDSEIERDKLRELKLNQHISQ